MFYLELGAQEPQLYSSKISGWCLIIIKLILESWNFVKPKPSIFQLAESGGNPRGGLGNLSRICRATNWRFVGGITASPSNDLIEFESQFHALFNKEYQKPYLPQKFRKIIYPKIQINGDSIYIFCFRGFDVHMLPIEKCVRPLGDFIFLPCHHWLRARLAALTNGDRKRSHVLQQRSWTLPQGRGLD